MFSQTLFVEALNLIWIFSSECIILIFWKNVYKLLESTQIDVFSTQQHAACRNLDPDQLKYSQNYVLADPL